MSADRYQLSTIGPHTLILAKSLFVSVENMTLFLLAFCIGGEHDFMFTFGCLGICFLVYLPIYLLVHDPITFAETKHARGWGLSKVAMSFAYVLIVLVLPCWTWTVTKLLYERHVLWNVLGSSLRFSCFCYFVFKAPYFFSLCEGIPKFLTSFHRVKGFIASLDVNL